MRAIPLFVCLSMSLACCGSDATPSASGDVAAGADTTSGSSGLAQACHDETPSNASCKDCCDCQVELSCDERTTCRDTCASLADSHFSAQSDLPAFEAPSDLGRAGDYGSCLTVADEQACKVCCDCDGLYSCGDMRHCRDACAGHTF
jgi:hypothetical protein